MEWIFQLNYPERKDKNEKEKKKVTPYPINNFPFSPITVYIATHKLMPRNLDSLVSLRVHPYVSMSWQKLFCRRRIVKFGLTLVGG